MARLLDPKAIKARIKDNTQVMKTAKKAVIDYMTAAAKNDGMSPDAADARKQLSAFIKASEAVKADNQKLVVAQTPATN